MTALFDRCKSNLRREGGAAQATLNELLRTMGLRPVGSGYIDIITPTHLCENFVIRVTALRIPIERVTLWCHNTEVNRLKYGCPHGYGGPSCVDGYYSELCEQDSFTPMLPDSHDPSEGPLLALLQDCNLQATEYIRSGMRRRPDYSPCLLPGIWLAVPEEWNNPWCQPC